MYTYQKFGDEDYRTTPGAYTFKTEKAAQAFCTMWNLHFEALNKIKHINGPLTRDEYEAACKYAGVDALPDSDCDSYRVRYGEFVPWLDSNDEPAGYTPERAVKMVLAAKRLAGIKRERKANPKLKRVDPDFSNVG